MHFFHSVSHTKSSTHAMVWEKGFTLREPEITNHESVFRFLLYRNDTHTRFSFGVVAPLLYTVQGVKLDNRL